MSLTLTPNTPIEIITPNTRLVITYIGDYDDEPWIQIAVHNRNPGKDQLYTSHYKQMPLAHWPDWIWDTLERERHDA